MRNLAVIPTVVLVAAALSIVLAFMLSQLTPLPIPRVIQSGCPLPPGGYYVAEGPKASPGLCG